MIEARRKQLQFGDGLIAEEIGDLRDEGFDEAEQRYTSMSLFPEDREIPADALDSVQVRFLVRRSAIGATMAA